MGDQAAKSSELSEALQEVHYMVAWPEAGCRELFGSRMGERAFLELHVCMKVDRRGFGRFMPEPKSDHGLVGTVVK